MELRIYWEVFWRRRWIFLYTLGLMVSLTMIWAFLSSPVYRATSKIMIRAQDTNTNIVSTVPSSAGKLNYLTSSNGIATIQAMIENSRSVTQVIEDLKLERKNGKPYSVIEILDPNFIKIIIGKIGVKVEQTEDAEVFEISGYSTNPELSANMANKLTSNFLRFSANLNKKEIGGVIGILENEISRLKAMIETSENIIKEYQLSNMSINLDDKASSLMSNLVTTELSLARLVVEKKAGHPDIQTALNQIAHLKRELKDIPDKSMQLTKLQRINTAMVNVYTSLLSDMEKAKVLQAMSITNASVIEKAEVPDIHKKYYIYFPKKKIMLLLALIIGGFFGVIAVFFAEYIDDTIKHPKDLKAWTGQRVLATITRMSKGTALFPPSESIIPVFHAIGDLGLSIKMGVKNTDGGKGFPQMLAVTSYGDGEGKSLVSSNLALLSSRIGFKTLLVDFNIKQPFLSCLYAKPSSKGLADFIKEKDIDRASIFKPKDNLHFLPIGSVSDLDYTPIINSPYFKEFLKIVRSEFDVVVFDTAPINKGVEPVYIARESDGAVFVVETGKFQLEQIRWALDKLSEANTHIIGVVLNKFEGKC